MTDKTLLIRGSFNISIASQVDFKSLFLNKLAEYKNLQHIRFEKTNPLTIITALNTFYASQCKFVPPTKVQHTNTEKRIAALEYEVAKLKAQLKQQQNHSWINMAKPVTFH